MLRILNWHIPNPGARLPAFYMERDYEPEKLRIHAARTPDVEGTIDILKDGVSILNAHAGISKSVDKEEHADDFLEGVVLEEGSIITCQEVDLGGAQNVTVQLELDSLDDEEEESD